MAQKVFPVNEEIIKQKLAEKKKEDLEELRLLAKTHDWYGLEPEAKRTLRQRGWTKKDRKRISDLLVSLVARGGKRSVIKVLNTYAPKPYRRLENYVPADVKTLLLVYLQILLEEHQATKKEKVTIAPRDLIEAEAYLLSVLNTVNGEGSEVLVMKSDTHHEKSLIDIDCRDSQVKRLRAKLTELRAQEELDSLLEIYGY
jgi:hypothetical protein